MWQIITLILSSFLTLLWTIPIALLQLVGLYLNKATDQKIVSLILNKLPKRSSVNENDKMSGFIWGSRPYVGYISVITTQNDSSKTEIWILTTFSYYKEISEHEKKNTDEKRVPINIDIYERRGHYFWLDYKKREFDITKYVPFEHQLPIIKKLVEGYHRNVYNKQVAFLYGNPGSCKSFISILLGKAFKSISLCDSWNPTEPGDDFGNLYNTVCPTYDKPLIVVLEEGDRMIQAIHHEKIVKHKSVPIQIYDKTTWNTLFDKFDRGFYPNTILIITSNQDASFIDKLDPSYIREGRTDLKLELVKPEHLRSCSDDWHKEFRKDEFEIEGQLTEIVIVADEKKKQE